MRCDELREPALEVKHRTWELLRRWRGFDHFFGRRCEIFRDQDVIGGFRKAAERFMAKS